MNKILFLLIVGSLTGCQKGPAGPTGLQGPAGSGGQSYTSEFEYNVYPDNSYTGSDSHWLDGSNPNSIPASGEIKVATGATSSSVAMGLIRFDLSYGIPSNATITAASLQLTTQTTTNLSSGSYVFGVHQVIPPPAGQVPWNDSSTWNVVVTPFGWNGGTSSAITQGVDYNSTPLDAVTVISSQINSSQVLLAWNVNPAIAQIWTNKNNNNYGVLISPEPQMSSSLSGFISFWDNSGNDQQKPKMFVEYSIP